MLVIPNIFKKHFVISEKQNCHSVKFTVSWDIRRRFALASINASIFEARQICITVDDCCVYEENSWDTNMTYNLAILLV